MNLVKMLVNATAVGFRDLAALRDLARGAVALLPQDGS
jgi:hypothetical protein